MAFGDHSRVQNQIDSQGGLSQNWLNNIRDIFIPQNQNIWNRGQVANDQANKDYAGIQSGYQNLGDQYGQQFGKYNSYLNGPGINYNPSNQNFGAYDKYANFADTGGYSPQDVQNIRARANAPIRATYANAQADLDRHNALAGNNMANYGAAKAKMARDLSINLGDQSQNTEAALAQMIQQGKLAGMSGMTGIDTSKMGEGLANAAQNLQGQGMDSNRILALLSGQGQTLAGQGNALQGQTSLYGATPGMANMYGNQLNQSNQNLVSTQQLQQQLMQLILNGTLGMSSVPGNFQSALGNIGSALNLGGQVAGIFGGIPGLGGAGIPGSASGNGTMTSGGYLGG